MHWMNQPILVSPPAVLAREMSPRYACRPTLTCSSMLPACSLEVSLAGRPGHRAAAEHVGVRVGYRLARECARVEHQPVSIFADALGDRDSMRLAHHLDEQTLGPARKRRHVRVVRLRYDQDMNGSLRVDIAEGDCPLALKYPVSRHLTHSDLAEQAVGHEQAV